ncbi:MAG TPA: hypothetical protein DEQ38_06480 [Elusimicrobia bacterium]|nr:MAG: hypothetical protein A2089_08945 [Elusimicrobia bacterium GWD2_63_28]HCC47748.1 hypothetical protein [Elusimicrobiota bacterium]
MEEAMKMEAKRPLMVWVISLFYFLTIGRSLLALYFIYSGAASVSPEHQALLARVTPFEWVLTVLTSIAGMAGSVLLFMRKKAAFPLFLAFFIVGVGMAIWPWFTQAGFAGITWQILLPTVIAKAILAWVCIYIRDLVLSGVLT